MQDDHRMTVSKSLCVHKIAQQVFEQMHIVEKGHIDFLRK